MYAQVRLSDYTAVGAPGPLPYCIANWSDVEVADLDVMKLDPHLGLAGAGFWPVDFLTPSYDPSSQVLVPPTSVDSADPATRRCKATATVRAMTADELTAFRASLTAYAATARYTKETAGITIAGTPIATDRDSQALITGAYSYVLAKPDATIVFKSTSGFISLSADQIQGIALAVGAHVQACFAAEGQIDGDIQSGKVTTTAMIDAAMAAVA